MLNNLHSVELLRLAVLRGTSRVAQTTLLQRGRATLLPVPGRKLQGELIQLLDVRRAFRPGRLSPVQLEPQNTGLRSLKDEHLITRARSES